MHKITWTIKHLVKKIITLQSNKRHNKISSLENLKFLHKEPNKRCYDIKPTIFDKFTLLKATCFLKKEIISIISIKLVEQQMKFLKFHGWQQARKNSWAPSPPSQTFPFHVSHSLSSSFVLVSSLETALLFLTKKSPFWLPKQTILD